MDEDYTNEILTEILYRSAKQEVLSGRYVCDIELSIKLAALQMAIDLEPKEDVLDIFGFVTVFITVFSDKYDYLCINEFIFVAVGMILQRGDRDVFSAEVQT